MLVTRIKVLEFTCCLSTRDPNETMGQDRMSYNKMREALGYLKDESKPDHKETYTLKNWPYNKPRDRKT